MSKTGGARSGAGRPRFEAEIQKRRNIALSDRLAEKARALGGSVSAGIRAALEQAGKKNDDIVHNNCIEWTKRNVLTLAQGKRLDAVVAQLSADIAGALNSERKRLGALLKEVQEERDLQRKIRQGIDAHMTQEEFRLVRSCLHPDRHPDDPERYRQAFEIFNRLEGTIHPHTPKKVLRERGWENYKRR